MLVNDLGKQLDKNGAGAGSAQLTTGYTAGSTIYPGNAPNLIFWVVLSAANGSNMTALKIKLQVSYDGSNFVDASSQSVAATDSTAFVVEQTVTATANATVYAGFRTPAGMLWKSARFEVQATAGGALVAGDAVQVYAATVR